MADRRRFALRLALVAAVGLALRLVYVLAFSRGLHDSGDSEFFHLLGNLIGDGRGFTEPIGLGLTGIPRPTALHPPLYPLLLGAGSTLGIDSYLGQRVIGCVIGACAIAAVGRLGRRVGGERVGLLAAALAAVYPVLIGADGAVMSESLYGLLVVLALLAAYRVREDPTLTRAAVGGGVIGLAALTRAEALALLVLALLPATRLRVKPLAVAVLACVVVLAPWTIRNWSAFDRFVPVSNNSGTLISGANCDRTYDGRLLGSWNIFCVSPGKSTNEAVAAAHERSAGLEYAGDHADRLPAVVGVRLMRTFGLYQAVTESREAESRSYGMALAGAIAWFTLIPAGVYGVVVLHRRKIPKAILLSPFALAALISVLGYGIPRFRHPADLVLCILAAAALSELFKSRQRETGAAGAGSASASSRS